MAFAWKIKQTYNVCCDSLNSPSLNNPASLESSCHLTQIYIKFSWGGCKGFSFTDILAELHRTDTCTEAGIHFIQG